MTALVLNTSNRSTTFFGAFIHALNKAVAMAKTVHHVSPTVADIKNVRAIAATV